MCIKYRKSFEIDKLKDSIVSFGYMQSDVPLDLKEITSEFQIQTHATDECVRTKNMYELHTL